MRIRADALPSILAESSAFEGVKRIAETLSGDFEKVFGKRPKVITESELSKAGSSLILVGTLGKSALLEALTAKGVLEPFSGWERYQIRLVQGETLPVFAEQGIKEVLVIGGSDKRGTIYGMFSLSEYIGVTALVDWGDAAPVRKEELEIGADIEILSKEPSVRYRGFFINDEWPCFGTWAEKHFGGFNAACYERVFEFLLRMKGNYLWPGMWTASFPLDGPGSANEELADLYGVVMGTSHHEPCLRASEEWNKVKGPDSPYGSEWDFRANEQGLTRYWADALERSGKYENMITIGMRGEYDSRLLGTESTMKENVDLLKRVITRQRELIDSLEKRTGTSHPLLLALYKEVEPYFYGDETTPGLKDWEGLKGVICMLCEDNYGQMRSLPTKEMLNRPGGFGMYYHLDYHGAPISYEWVDCTPLSRVWEQMCEAYDYGIRDLWIVNAGDIKFHEVPLTFLLAMAWDYERWGSSNLASPKEYMREWADKSFSGEPEETRKEIAEVYTGYLDLNARRRPEALHAEIYHPCHYEETARVLGEAKELEKRSEDLYQSLSPDSRNAYYSMVHYQLTASMDVLKMHLYAGLNHRFARQGRIIANTFSRLAKDCLEADQARLSLWSKFLSGKWDGMQLEAHIGFTKWNEDDCRNPLLMTVLPVPKPRMSVSRADREETFTRDYDGPLVVEVPDFLYPGNDAVRLEIANTGKGSFTYTITSQSGEELPAWLSVAPLSDTVTKLQTVTLSCSRRLLPKDKETVTLLISDGDTFVTVRVQGQACKDLSLPSGTFLENGGVIAMEAAHFCRKKDVGRSGFVSLNGYGKYGSAVKVLPCTADFSGKEKERPQVTYRFFLSETGTREVKLFFAPTNSTRIGKGIFLGVRMEKGKESFEQVLCVLPEDFQAGDFRDERWAQGVLDQERVSTMEAFLTAGLWELTLTAMEPGLVLERVLVSIPGAVLPSYLGPRESFQTP